MDCKRGSALRVLLLMLTFGAARAAPAEDWIKLFGGPTYHLVSRIPDAAITVPVPVVLTKVAPEQVTVELQDVLFNNRHETQYIDAFRGKEPSLRVAPPAAGLGPSIMITVEPRKTAGDGTYTLSLVARAENKDETRLQVQIIYPAAKLRAVKTLKLERVWPYSPAEWLTVPLQETAGVAVCCPTTRIRDFEPPVSVSLVDTPMPPGIPAQKDGTAYLKLQAKAPLGTHAGVAEIDAEQLLEPLSVPIQIVERRTRWLIPIFMLFGILIGYFLRTGLAARIEHQEARLKAADLLERIELDWNRRPDARFRERLRQPGADLSSALPVATTADLAAKAQKLDAEWQAALQDLELRRTALQQRIDSYAALAATQWRLFGGAEEARRKLRDDVAAAATTLAGHDAVASEKQLETARQAFVAALDKTITRWRLELQDDLSRLGPANLSLPANVSAWLKGAVAGLQSSLARVVHVPVSATSAELVPILQAVHDARANLSDLSQQLRLSLESSLRDLAVVLRDQLQVDGASLAPIREQGAAVDRMLQGLEGEPERVLSFLVEAEQAEPLCQLDAAIAGPLRAAAGKVGQPTRKPLEDQIAARQYAEAAAAIAQAIDRQAAAQQGKILGDRQFQTASVGIAPAGAPWLARSDTRTPPLVARFVRSEPAPETLGDLRARTWRQLLAAKALRTVLTGSLILASGYLVFASAFVGTFEELAKVFSWAFALDVSVATLATVLPRR